MSARLIDQLVHGFRQPSSAHSPVESRRVKRALFGPVDHDENYRFVQRELARNREEASRRWNYDFGQDTPLPGRYQWETVRRMPVERRNKDSDNTESRSSIRNSNKVSNPASSDARSPLIVEKEEDKTKEDTRLACDNPPTTSSTNTTTTASSSSSSNQRLSRYSKQQTHMTDYLQHRKRSKSKVKVQERKTETEKIVEVSSSLTSTSSTTSTTTTSTAV